MKSYVKITIAVIIGIVLLGGFFFYYRQYTPGSRASEISDVQSITGQLNSSLSNKTTITTVRSLAQRRKEEMIKVMQTDPQRFLNEVAPQNKVTVTASNKTQITELQNQGLLEKAIKITGRFRHIKMDDFQNKKSTHQYFVQVNPGANEVFYQVYISNSHEAHGMTLPKNLSTVQVSGVGFGQEMAIKGDQLQVITVAPTLTNSLGKKKMLAIMVNFQNNTAQRISIARMNEILFTSQHSLEAFYREVSNGQFSVNTTTGPAVSKVIGYYTLPVNNDNCKANWRSWTTMIRQWATSQGINLSSYDMITYVLNRSDTCASGWADMVGGEAWINSYTEDEHLKVLAHENGHVIGLHHADGLHCENWAVDHYEISGPKSIWNSTPNIDVTCTRVEYGNGFDTMGGNALTLTYNGVFRYASPSEEGLGWLPKARLQEVIVPATGQVIVDIAPLESPSTGIQLLKINKPDTQQAYYVEYRTKTGEFDKDLNLNGEYGAVMVNIWSPNHPTMIVDTTFRDEFNNAFLKDNDYIYDYINNIVIKQVSHAPGYAKIAIGRAGQVPVLTPLPLVTPTWTPTPTPKQTLTLEIRDNKGAKLEFATGKTAIGCWGKTVPAGYITGIQYQNGVGTRQYNLTNVLTTSYTHCGIFVVPPPGYHVGSFSASSGSLFVLYPAIDPSTNLVGYAYGWTPASWTLGRTISLTMQTGSAPTLTKGPNPTLGPGCSYRFVQCIKAPCNPIIICPTKTPTATPRKPASDIITIPPSGYFQ